MKVFVLRKNITLLVFLITSRSNVSGRVCGLLVFSAVCRFMAHRAGSLKARMECMGQAMTRF